MNSIERVMATITGAEKDRPPLSLTLSLYGARLIDCPLNEYYANSAFYTEGQMAVFEEIGPDIIFGPFAVPLLGKAFGGEVKLYDNQAPNIRKYALPDPNSFEQLNVEKAIESNEIQYFVRSVEGLVKNLGDKVPIAPIMLSPVDIPIMLMGLESWLDMVLTDSTAAHRVIEKTTEFFLQLSTLYFNAGASFIVLPSPFINPGVVTKSIALHFQEVLAMVFAQTKGPLFLHEGGAKITPFLEVFKSLPQVVGVLINSRDELSVARNLMGSTAVLAGNFEGPEVPAKSPEQIREKIISILNDRKEDSHFILASSGADIPHHTPIENIRLIKQTLNEYYGC